MSENEGDVAVTRTDGANPSVHSPAANRGGCREFFATEFLPSIAAACAAIALLIELSTHSWREMAFDPIPTWIHVGAIALVPMVIVRSITVLRHERPLRVALGAAFAVSTFYTIAFLPALPVGVIAIIFIGIGLILLSPLLTLCALWSRIARLPPDPAAPSRRLCPDVKYGFVATTLVLGTVEFSIWREHRHLVAAVGTDAVARAKAFTALRRDAPDLERWSSLESVEGASPVTATAAMLESLGRDRRARESERRTSFGELHYRLFGTNPDWVSREVVGARSTWRSGFEVRSSTLHGSCDESSRCVNVAWELEIAHHNILDREAWIEFECPAGAIASGLTLYVGEAPRECVIVSRSKGTAVYENIVNQELDPALLTQRWPGRYQLRVFPVRRGLPRRVIVEFTVPIELSTRDEGSAIVRLPRLVDLNALDPTPFDDLRHELTLSTTSEFVGAASGSEYTATLANEDLPRGCESGELRVVLRDRNRVVAAPLVADASRRVLIDWRPAPEPPEKIVVAIHASTPLAPYAARIRDALVGLGDRIVAVVVTTDIEPRVFDRVPERIDCVGGHDQFKLLGVAGELARAREATRIVWLAAPQPFAFSDDRVELPKVEYTYLQLPAGPNRVFGALLREIDLRVVAASGDVARDVANAAGVDTATLVPHFDLAASDSAAVRDAIAGSAAAARFGLAGLIAGNTALDEDFELAHARAEGVVTARVAALVLENDAMHDEHGIPRPGESVRSREGAAGAGSEAGIVGSLLVVAAVAFFALRKGSRG